MCTCVPCIALATADDGFPGDAFHDHLKPLPMKDFQDNAQLAVVGPFLWYDA